MTDEDRFADDLDPGALDGGLLALDALMRRVDLGPGRDPADPLTWTIDGEPLTAAEVATLRAATPADWQAIHDLTVADAAAAGLPSPCRDHPNHSGGQS